MKATLLYDIIISNNDVSNCIALLDSNYFGSDVICDTGWNWKSRCLKVKQCLVRRLYTKFGRKAFLEVDLKRYFEKELFHTTAKHSRVKFVRRSLLMVKLYFSTLLSSTLPRQFSWECSKFREQFFYRAFMKNETVSFLQWRVILSGKHLDWFN